MKTHTYLVVLLTVLATAVAAADGDGGYGGAFLQVPLGARPTAMGGAYVGVSDDGSGALYNPAGLAGLPYREFSSSFRAMTLGRKLGYASIMFPIQGEATLGLHWVYAGSGSVEERDRDGALVGRDFSQNTHQFSVLFAKRFEPWIAVGVNMSYLHAQVSNIHANAVGFDFGGMLYVNELMDRERRDQFFAQDVKLGLVVRNVTKQFRFNSGDWVMEYTTDNLPVVQTDNFPLEVDLGGSAKFLSKKLLIALDAMKNGEQSFKGRAGGEYQIAKNLALRTGYSVFGFAAGAGFQFDLKPKQTLAIDYAFSSGRADAGSEHMFTIGFCF